MYITSEEYAQIYEQLDEKIFNRLCFDACRVMDIHTTGIDNVKKLKHFFPTDSDAAEAVKRCAAELINLLPPVPMKIQKWASAENTLRLFLRAMNPYPTHPAITAKPQWMPPWRTERSATN